MEIEIMTLWEYMNKEHGLSLLDSEIQEILSLARQEIELPAKEEMIDFMWDNRDWLNSDTKASFEWGWEWTCNKIRNPYPQTIRFEK